MMHEPAAMDRPSIMQCLLRRIEHEAGASAGNAALLRVFGRKN
jgi:hypothetical protein